MRRETVCLYGEDNSFVRFITPQQRDELLADGSYERHFMRAAGAAEMRECGIRRKPNHKPSNRQSPCALTSGEMQANVGITRGEAGLPARRGAVMAAQIKIKLWPHIYDRKAVMVPARA